MLPFTKRPTRDEVDQPSSRDARPQPGPPPSRRQSAFPAPPSDRPRVFHRAAEPSLSDEDQTSIMASVRSKSSFPPVASSTRAHNRPMLRDQTPSSLRPPPPRSPPPSHRPPPSHQFGMETPSARLSPQIAPAALIPREMRVVDVTQVANHHIAASGPSSMGSPAPDSIGAYVTAQDPPATVITTRTRLARPTVSWAAALVAMGVFVGLVTAVVARGDADSLIDATASFVDPSHARAGSQTPGPVVANVAAMGSPLPVLPPVFAPPAVIAAAPVVAAPLAPLTAGVPVLTASDSDSMALSPPATRALVAYSAPTKSIADLPIAKAEPRPVVRTQSRPRYTYVAPVAQPRREAPPARVAKAAKASSDDDGAAKAAELADEQLKAALR